MVPMRDEMLAMSRPRELGVSLLRQLKGWSGGPVDMRGITESCDHVALNAGPRLRVVAYNDMSQQPRARRTYGLRSETPWNMYPDMFDGALWLLAQATTTDLGASLTALVWSRVPVTRNGHVGNGGCGCRLPARTLSIHTATALLAQLSAATYWVGRDATAPHWTRAIMVPNDRRINQVLALLKPTVVQWTAADRALFLHMRTAQNPPPIEGPSSAARVAGMLKFEGLGGWLEHTPSDPPELQARWGGAFSPQTDEAAAVRADQQQSMRIYLTPRFFKQGCLLHPKGWSAADVGALHWWRSGPNEFDGYHPNTFQFVAKFLLPRYTGQWENERYRPLIMIRGLDGHLSSVVPPPLAPPSPQHFAPAQSALVSAVPSPNPVLSGVALTYSAGVSTHGIAQKVVGATAHPISAQVGAFSIAGIDRAGPGHAPPTVAAAKIGGGSHAGTGCAGRRFAPHVGAGRHAGAGGGGAGARAERPARAGGGGAGAYDEPTGDEEEVLSTDEWYETHDNGGRPFLVRVDETGRRLSVHARLARAQDADAEPTEGEVSTRPETADYAGKPMVGFDNIPYANLWIGRDVSDATFLDGNSFVLQHAGAPPGDLVYIGTSIRPFKLVDPAERVLAYLSPVQNSDVVYPWLVTDRRTYLLIEDVVVENRHRRMPPPGSDKRPLNPQEAHALDDNEFDPYHEYYDNQQNPNYKPFTISPA